MVDYLKSCKTNIAILSNLCILDKPRIDKQMGLKDFKYVWLSYELGCEKPYKEIYEIVERDCMVKPNNILFIDDTDENIETAKERGWNTCLAEGKNFDIIKTKIDEFLNKDTD